jgi:general stress protein 26
MPHDDIKALAAQIRDIRVAMLVTRDANGQLRARPMATQDVAFDGDLWFFAAADSDKAREIADDNRVAVIYADPDRDRHVSVSGIATLLEDPERARELWTPRLSQWFARGVDDPNLRLLRVEVDQAEYWDSPGGPVTQLFGFLQRAVGAGPATGVNRTIEF